MEKKKRRSEKELIMTIEKPYYLDDSISAPELIRRIYYCYGWSFPEEIEEDDNISSISVEVNKEVIPLTKDYFYKNMLMPIQSMAPNMVLSNFRCENKQIIFVYEPKRV